MTKNPVGPPTKYRDTMPEKALKWLKTKVDEYESVGTVASGIKRVLKVSLPTIEELAVVLEVTKETLYQWEGVKGKEELTDVLGKVREEQHRRLVSKGLSGEYNSTIAKLILHKHGYSDKQEVDQKIQLSGFGKAHEELSKLDD